MKDMSEGIGAAVAHNDAGDVVVVVVCVCFDFEGVVTVVSSMVGGVAVDGMVDCWFGVGGGVSSWKVGGVVSGGMVDSWLKVGGGVVFADRVESWLYLNRV